MPILIALAGAFLTGLIYWVRYGNGLEHLDHALRDWRAGRRRRASELQIRAAPLRSLRHPADAAGVLLMLVARQRGLPTPEQESEVLTQMRDVTEPGDDLATRMAVIRHAAEQAPEADAAVRVLAPLLRDRLTGAERNDLSRMLGAVAAVHQGPTEAQERFIEQVQRALHEDR
ncbi:hypothetical protein [Methylobacterium sp. J-068]|uniref:hypothetical protein n=1 Tax=Methylobacterium sp. J-068 TaxID=2836649 RepID=UPI001FB9126F|nr:hypothetical protein [Methylobacterium sp. J-068]MCJ2036489.1 hypothetical protein [Methylobacterium sp. J-068]